ncbi:MAG: hypothetical protein KAJ51_13955, partial [Thermoplasmata archaeon]|nr:hypothetical protein [Thermoplasmata archaeon]
GYSEKYHEPYAEEFELEPDSYEPHDRFERERYQSSDYGGWDKPPKARKMPLAESFISGFPFQDSKYNVKIAMMQLTATAALIVIFLLNYVFNEGYVIQLSNFSGYVGGPFHPPIVAAIFGTLAGWFLYIFPAMGRDFKRTIVIGTIIILIFFFSAAPLIVLISTGDAYKVGEAFARTLHEFIKIFAVMLYWAPVMLGVYGIWARKNLFVGLAAMFLFFIIILYDGLLLYIGAEMTKSFDNWPVYVLFALALFCFIEMADSAISFTQISNATPYSDENMTHENHLNRILQIYFVYFLVFAVLIFIITGVIFSFEGVLKAFGSEQIGESIEIQSIYGITIALIITVLVIVFIGIILRHESGIRERLGKAIFGEPTQDLYEARREQQYSTSELAPYWPSSGTKSKPTSESDVEEDHYF